MSGVGILGWSVASSLGPSADVFAERLFGAECGLLSQPELPAGIGVLPFDACVGVLSNLESAPRSPHFPQTRQFDLAWASLAPLVPLVRDTLSHWGGSRVALVLGTSTGGVLESERALAHYALHGELPSDYSCPDGHAFDAALRRLAQELGISGPAYVVSAACSSSAKALASARRLLLAGACDAALVGGVDTLCKLTLWGFHSLGVLSSSPCQPFTQDGSGMNVAEGGAWLLLDRRALGLGLLGAGESSDAYHLVTPEPTGAGAQRAMLAALADAGLSSTEVDYVNAHGTGTQANDIAERRAIFEVFGDVAFTSTKNQHGHLLGAAGATEAVVCLEVLRKKWEMAPPGQGMRARLGRPARFAMSNSLAFGGANVSLLFGPVEEELPAENGRLTAFVGQMGAWCGGEEPSAPAASLLSTRQRARAPLLTKMLAEVMGQLGDVDRLKTLPIVLASALGPVQLTLDLLAQQQQGECSPLRFQASIHSGALGVLSLALDSHEFFTALAAGQTSVAMGLLEAICWLKRVPLAPAIALLAGDEHPPFPLSSEDYSPLAVGLVLQNHAGGAIARLELRRSDAAEPAQPFPIVPGRERLERNPCGIGLGLLHVLERRSWGHYALGDGWGAVLAGV